MFKISFDFNEETQKVSNFKCESVNNKPKAVNSNGEPIIEVADNKLIISPEALNLIEAVAGDRIAINYKQVSKELTYPIIGKSDKFADKESGNVLSKSNTVSYRGKQRTMLLEYGCIFKLDSAIKDGVYKMTPVNDDSSTELASEDLKEEVAELSDDVLDNFDELDVLPF